MLLRYEIYGTICFAELQFRVNLDSGYEADLNNFVNKFNLFWVELLNPFLGLGEYSITEWFCL